MWNGTPMKVTLSVFQKTLPDGVAFTGEVKPVPKATAYEKQPTPTIRQRVRPLREPSFPAPFDRIGDSQIPLTRQTKFDLCLR